ncbi:MAG: hypothetical protein LUE98_09740 [Tannerellaceae bacterium]|nr:hypothetical protein [Tannerellaceae bacterium]
MALKYRLVERKDFSKGAQEDDKLFYGQVSANDRIKFQELCETLSVASTLSYPDVSCILKALILVIKNELLHGNSVHLGAIGNLRMMASSEGAPLPNMFHPSMFKRPRIVYTPGVMLRDVVRKVTYEPIPEKYITYQRCPLPHVGEDD